MILIFTLLPSLSFAQFGPLLDQFAKIYPSECPTTSPSENRSDAYQESYEPEGYSGHDYSQEPQHFSWDNIYLEEVGPEVILNPYEEESEEGSY